MDDEQLRAAEKRWRESGLDEDESAYLWMRMRIGDLQETRLLMAAKIGYMPAVLAINAPHVPMKSFFSGLWHALVSNHEGLARVAIVAAHQIGLWRRTKPNQWSIQHGHHLLQDAGDEVVHGRYDLGFDLAIRAVYSYLDAGGISVPPNPGGSRHDRLRAMIAVVDSLEADVAATVQRHIQRSLARWLLNLDFNDEVLHAFHTKQANESFDRRVELEGYQTP